MTYEGSFWVVAFSSTTLPRFLNLEPSAISAWGQYGDSFHPRFVPSSLVEVGPVPFAKTKQKMHADTIRLSKRQSF
jgi:hypothetical protein